MKTKNPLAAIFLTVFMDMLGVGIIIPIFAPLLISTNLLLPEGTPLSARTMMLGLLIAAYPMAQFFGAPIIGALSDNFGRKKLWILSLIGTCIGYILTAIGIFTNNIALWFIARIIDGFTGGNISIALSSIADISDEKSKVKNFGLIGMSFGLGLIFGPFIGGMLGDNKISPFFHAWTPLIFAALLTFINIIIVLLNYEDTLKTRVHTKVSLLTGFKNIGKALRMNNMRTMFIVLFLLSFGFNFYTQFFQVYLIEKFGFRESNIGMIYAYLGIWIAFTQGFVTRFVSKKLEPGKVLQISLLCTSLFIAAVLLPKNPAYLYFIIPFYAMSNGLTNPNASAIVSNMAGKESQGEILGINQSIQSVGQALPPMISGALAGINTKLPIVAASILIFTAWVVFIAFFRKSTEVFHEA